MQKQGRGLESSSYIIPKDYYQFLQGPVDLGVSYQSTFRKPLRGSNYLTGRGANFFPNQVNFKPSYYGRGTNISSIYSLRGRGFFSNIWNGLKKGISAIGGIFKKGARSNVGKSVLNTAAQVAKNVANGQDVAPALQNGFSNLANVAQNQLGNLGNRAISYLPQNFQGPAQNFMNSGLNQGMQQMQNWGNMGINQMSPYLNQMSQFFPNGSNGNFNSYPYPAMRGQGSSTKRKRPIDHQVAQEEEREGKTHDEIKRDNEQYLMDNLLHPRLHIGNANENKSLFTSIASSLSKKPGYPNLHHISADYNNFDSSTKQYSIPKIHKHFEPNKKKFSSPNCERLPDFIPYDKTLIDPMVVKLYKLRNAKIKRRHTNPICSQISNIEWDKADLFPNHFAHAHDMFTLQDASIHSRNLDKIEKSDNYDVGSYSYYNPNIAKQMDQSYGKDTMGSGIYKYGTSVPGMTFDIRKKRWEITGGAAFKAPTPGWKYKTGGWKRESLPMFAYETNQARGPFGLDLRTDEAAAAEIAQQQIEVAPRNKFFSPSSSFGNYALTQKAKQKTNRMNKVAPEQESFVKENSGRSFEQIHLQNLLQQQEAVNLANSIEHEQGQYGNRYNTELPTANGQITQAAFDPSVMNQMDLAKLQSQQAVSALNDEDEEQYDNGSSSGSTRGSGIKGGSLMGVQKVESNQEISDKYKDYIKQLLE